MVTLSVLQSCFKLQIVRVEAGCVDPSFQTPLQFERATNLDI